MRALLLQPMEASAATKNIAAAAAFSPLLSSRVRSIAASLFRLPSVAAPILART